jgi:D-alanyl-D-alanine carboxypeptidase (penicillin-binding protein 5/6)
MKALKEGRIKETDLVTVSQYAYGQEGSRMFLEVGQQITVIELLKGILIVSGNDASVAMAEFLGGTEQSFAAEMTRVAREIGCTNTCFKNSSGIPEEGHQTTAKDLITMSIRLFEDFPEYYAINKELSYTFNKITQENRNLLLNKNLGCDGIKTGFAEKPGYGMVASASQKGRRLFLVCTGLRSKKQRADENIRLLQWGFQSFANYTVAPKGTSIVEIPVHYGTQNTVGVEPDKHFLTLNRVQLSQIKTQIKHYAALRAPIKAGDTVGEMIVTHPEWQAPIVIKLLAKQNVEEAFFLNRIGQTLAYIFAGSKAS